MAALPLTVVLEQAIGPNSWSVRYHGWYNNSRAPYVEVGAANVNQMQRGAVYSLSRLHVAGRQVNWTVDSLVNSNTGREATMTIYFGADAAQQLPNIQTALQQQQRVIRMKQRWGANSWLVDYSGPYQNSRPPHVEIGPLDTVEPGETFPLEQLRAQGDQAVMWTVRGLQNQLTGGPAHFTVHYGPGASTHWTLFRACAACGRPNAPFFSGNHVLVCSRACEAQFYADKTL